MDYVAILSIVVTVLITVVGASWRQYNSIRTLIDDSKMQILNKLEYHERHDDERFSQVSERFGQMNNSLWEIRVRNAAIDGNGRYLNKHAPKKDE